MAIELLDSIRGILSGFDWKAIMKAGGKRSFLDAAYGAVNYLRSPATPGNHVPEGGETLGAQFRRQSGRLARAWTLCSGSNALEAVRPEVQFYDEVRVWMAKCDANERIERGEPIPEEIERLLANLVATSTASGEVLDIYEAAGMPKPTLTDLSPEFVAKAQQARNQHLAIEALRKMIIQESARTTRHNVIRARAFSDRVSELMTRYTNQQLTSAEVIAALVEFAKEVAAETNRGSDLHSATGRRTGVLRRRRPERIRGGGTRRRRTGPDRPRTGCGDAPRRPHRLDRPRRRSRQAALVDQAPAGEVRIPSDKQPGAIKLVMEQMESMAPRYAERV